MRLRSGKYLHIVLVYLLLLAAAVGSHAYFIVSGAYFNETCCDSFRQVSHFYPFLQREFSAGNFFWSWNYGLGGDLLAGFAYYYSTSPFFWLTMLFPHMETLIDVFEARLYISIAKLFIAMVLMFHLLRYLKLLNVSAILGSLIYGGSAFFMFNSLRYDFMVDGMIYLPFLILAFEYATDKRKPYILMAAVFLTVGGNFYLGFINSLYLGMYVVMRYFLREKLSIKEFAMYMLRFFGSYFAGLLAAAFLFLPAVYAFLHVDRFYYEESLPLLFGADFYQNLPYWLLFMSNESFLFITVFPLLVVFLFPLGFLTADKFNRRRFWFSLFVCLLVLIPFSYSLFNGLSAIQYRWLYLFIFTVAWMAAFLFDDLWKGKLKGRPILVWTGLFGFLIVLLFIKEELTGRIVLDREVVFLGMALVFAALLIVLVRTIKKTTKAVAAGLLIALTLFNGVLMNNLLSAEFLGNPWSLAERQDELLESYATETETDMIEAIQAGDDSFYRIMWDQLREFNAPLLFGYNGFSTYSSLLAGNVHVFMKRDYNVRHWNSPSLFQNLDNRLYLETALAAKYYIKPQDATSVPFGYSPVFENEAYEVYENDYALPIGFLYDQVIDNSQLDGLTFAERDQLLLHAAAVENTADLGLPEFDLQQLTAEERLVDLTDVGLKNVELTEDGLLVVAEEAALAVDNPWSGQSGEVMAELTVEEISGAPFEVSVLGKTFRNNGEGSVYNYPREKIVINVGHDLEEDPFHLLLSPGTYRLSELLLTFTPYEPYPELVETLQAQSLENVTYTGRSVQGTVEAERDSLLFMSVPFSPGWQVEVDGEKVEPLEINTAFIGIPVSRGTHQIEITYTTPYFMTGLYLSLAVLLLLLTLELLKRKRRHHT